MSWNPKEKLTRFVTELQRDLGADLASVVLFGSVARGEAVAGHSDVNLLLLLEHADRAVLHRGAKSAQRWREEAGGVPLLFTPAEWKRSADVFAVELADMLDHRRVLHGPDPVAGLAVTPTNLRLQVEREIRGKLAQMRRGIFLASDSPADLGRLLLGVAPSLASYLRAVLRLAGDPVPGLTPDVVEAAAARVRAPAEPFLEVWSARARAEGWHPSAATTDGVFELVLATAGYVDSLEGR